MLTNTAQTKTAAYAYDAWGNTIASSGTQATLNPWQYASGYKDTTTSLTKFGARYYDPTTGRFNQTDPSEQESNAYLYANADPVNYGDPTGLDTAVAEIEGCFLLCGSVGVAVGEDQVPHLVLGGGVGPKSGVNLNIGLATGSPTPGIGVPVGCSAAFGAGGFLGGSIDSSGGVNGSAGASFGSGVGCSAGLSWTF